MTSRALRRNILLVVGILAAWMVGAVVVRLGLDRSDTYPYSAASPLSRSPLRLVVDRE